MANEKADLSKLREVLHSTIVEVEIAHRHTSRLESDKREPAQSRRYGAQTRARQFVVFAIEEKELG